MEDQKIYKTAIYTLNAVARYNEKNRETINQKAKDSYNARKTDPEFIAKRREYARVFRGKQKALKLKEEKTPPPKTV